MDPVRQTTNPTRRIQAIQPGQVRYVRALYEDKAEFLKCLQAEKLPRSMTEHDGFACVPYKSRPAIILCAADEREGNHRYYLVAVGSSHQKEGEFIRRMSIGQIGTLEGAFFLYLRAPIQYHEKSFGEQKGTVDRMTLQNVRSILNRIGMQADARVNA